jgi:hypothetical protein
MNRSTFLCRNFAGLLSLLLFASPLARAADAPTSGNAAALLALTPRTNLPPDADDPLRPQNTRRVKPGSIYWTDDVGVDDHGNPYNQYKRSSFGSWSNYDEAKADLFPLPELLVLKNGQLVKDAALDRRWAIVYASCSGEGGAKLLRRNYGETPDNLVDSFSYWMAGNFRKYGGHWNDLPVDAHELIALVAPRPVFVTGGTQDRLADPHGQFLAAEAAGPVYRLLGKKDLGTTEMPAPDVALISGDVAFREHVGAHTDLPDWPIFLEYASKYLRAPAVKN